MKKIVLTALAALSVLSYAQDNDTPYRAEAERLTALKDTKLNVSFDFDKEHLLGEAWITAHPYFYAQDELILDAKGMLIHSVRMNDKKGRKLNYTYANDSLVIDLGKTFTRDQDYTVYIDYTARPNEVKQEGSAAITDAKGLYFIDPRDEDPEKPTQIWTQGETESSSAWFPTIDKPNQKTSEEIFITVPERFVTLSNGDLIDQKKNKNGTRTDHWKQDEVHAPYLFFMGIGEFAVIEDSWKGKKVDYYVEEEYAPYAQEIFGLTPEMMTFYSDIFQYEYPWDKYSQMVARDYVSGAMENTTAVIHMSEANQKHGELVDENTWEATIAHELAHHWFGDLVTAESWSNLTVNESFANYSEYLWYEHKYGKDKADAHRADDMFGYLMGNNYGKNLVRHDFSSREDMFDGVSYNKGGAILHMLRSFLGDDAFFSGLSNYLKSHEYGKAEAHDLRLALEETSGKDLNWFFNQWYYSNGHPKLTVVVENNQLNIRQTQGEPLFEFPLEIAILKNGEKTIKNFWVEKKELNTFNLDVENADLVVVNSNYDLLAEVEQEKSTEQLAIQYELMTDEFNFRKEAIDKLAGQQLTNDLALNTLGDALDDPYYGLRIAAIEALDISSSKISSMIKPKLTSLAKKDNYTLVQAAALSKLGELKDPEYQSLFNDKLSSESFSVQAAALDGLKEIDPNLIEGKIDSVDEEVIKNSPKLLATMIPVWIETNQVDKQDLLFELAAFYGFMQFQNPEMAGPATQAFDWIMATDNVSVTNKIANMYKQGYEQLKDAQPMAIPFLATMAKHGLEVKTKAYEENKSDSLKKQVETLQEVVDLIK